MSRVCRGNRCDCGARASVQRRATDRHPPDPRAEFAAGDRLILYSDGLIEAIDDDGEPFGFDRFERVLLDAGHLSAEGIKKTLLGSIRKFTRNRPPEDDQTLVVVSFDREAAGAEEVEAAYATAT
ncbi:MAG: hypothetical protein DMF59_07545 [Acidobacteria bacterium]|nr:MAG: hypothetical protein DMF59_07545 [Acidobacteriota bacterium]